MAARKTKAADATAEAKETPAGELIVLETITPENAPAIFGHNSLGKFVEAVRVAVIDEVPDLSTDKGRKRVASIAAAVSRSKTAIDDAGRAYLKKLKEQPKVIEGELRVFLSDMDALRDKVRAPLNEWEAARDAEEARLQQAIDTLVQNFTLDPDSTVADIQGALFGLEQEPLTEEDFGKRLEEAEQKRSYGITLLNDQLAKRQQYEREQAELVENRRKIAALEEEKRIKAAADQAVEDERKRAEEERQRIAHQQQLQRDEDARKLREAEHKAMQAENDRLAAEERAEDERNQANLRQQQAVEQERLRLEREQAERERLQREQEEQQRRDDEARAANRVHQGKINKAALDAILAINMAGDGQVESFLMPDEAKAIVSAIIRGQIPSVTITY